MPNFKIIWGLLMAVLFVVLGYVFAFSPLFKESYLPNWAKIGIAIIFCFYGISRGYRIWKNK